jgi:Spy/CpxP family protein refolding chaperone
VVTQRIQIGPLLDLAKTKERKVVPLKSLSAARGRWRALVFGLSILLFSGAMTSFSQAPMAPMGQPATIDAADQNKQLADQITELWGQVARLQAAVQQSGPGKKVNHRSGMKMSSASNKGMGMMDEKSEMGMTAAKGATAPGSAAMGMKDDQGGMVPGGNAPMSPGSMMNDKTEMSGMPMGSSGKPSPAPDPAMGVGDKVSGGNAAMSAMPPAAGGMATMSGPSSAMPGQADTSHLYHMGSNGFFLNHSRHITLTPDQRLTLNYVKEKEMLDRTSEQRGIDQAEQQLYALTGADQPDIAKIQAKIVEIEKLRADQRMNSIRAVATASNVLTPEQRKALVGTITRK